MDIVDTENQTWLEEDRKGRSEGRMTTTAMMREENPSKGGEETWESDTPPRQ